MENNTVLNVTAVILYITTIIGTVIGAILGVILGLAILLFPLWGPICIVLYLVGRYR